MKKSLLNKLQNAGDTITNLSTNGLLIAGGLKGIDALSKMDYSTATQALAAGAATLGINYLNKKGVIKGFSKGINNLARKLKGKAMPLARTFALTAYLGGSVFLAGNGLKGTYTDFSKKYIKDIKEKKEITSSIKTPQGKFERTYRWDRALDNAEEKYDIPKGLLKGLAMRESYGDPLKLNESGDGGAGLFQFQPGTAKEYGLKIYGNSNNTGKDKKNGNKLKRIVKEDKYNYKKLAKIDDRFNVNKSSNAAAKFLKNLYRRFGTWDRALSAYNRGTPARNPKATNHVRFIREYQNYYNKRDKN